MFLPACCHNQPTLLFYACEPSNLTPCALAELQILWQAEAAASFFTIAPGLLRPGGNIRLVFTHEPHQRVKIHHFNFVPGQPSEFPAQPRRARWEFLRMERKTKKCFDESLVCRGWRGRASAGLPSRSARIGRYGMFLVNPFIAGLVSDNSVRRKARVGVQSRCRQFRRISVNNKSGQTNVPLLVKKYSQCFSQASKPEGRPEKRRGGVSSPGFR